jgi:YHS domain-containing protein
MEMEKRKNKFVGGLFIALAVSLIISTAIAQEAEKDKWHGKDVTKCMKQQCGAIMSASVYLDSPAVLIGQAESLQLSDEQIKSLKKVQAQARKKAMKILTSEQKKKLDKIPPEPINLAMLYKKMSYGHGRGTCPADCSKPCCAAKSKTCPKNCSKPCCAAKSKTCPKDCTKPCCAAKSKTRPKSCTKPCCAGKNKLSAEQKTCPIMGNPINKELYAEYKGKKVYFCCPGCKPKFEGDPEKYVAKLPQFSK